MDLRVDLVSPPCDLYFDAAKKSLFEHCILSAAGSYDLSMAKLKSLFSLMIKIFYFSNPVFW